MRRLILVRALCLACLPLTVAGTIAWEISVPLSCVLFLAMLASLTSAIVLKPE